MPNAGGQEHYEWLYRLRMLEALDRLPYDDERHQDQGNSVDQRGQDAYAVVAKGLTRIGRAIRLRHREPGQP